MMHVISYGQDKEKQHYPAEIFICRFSLDERLLMETARRYALHLLQVSSLIWSLQIRDSAQSVWIGARVLGGGQDGEK